jgi:zinc-ribbon domain
MAEFCTCGAQLPEDALFCHKCGKPQRDIAPAEPEPPPRSQWQVPPGADGAPIVDAVPSDLPRRQPLPVNFRNPVAVRIAALVSLGASALFFLPYVNWLAAGYFAVFLYRRKTGTPVNLGAGVRMGWMTGVLTFAILAVFFAGFVVLLNSGGMREMFQQQFGKDPRVQQTLNMIQNVPDVLGMLANFFIFTTFLSMAGGALGAKLLGSSNPPRGGKIA